MKLKNRLITVFAALVTLMIMNRINHGRHNATATAPRLVMQEIKQTGGMAVPALPLAKKNGKEAIPPANDFKYDVGTARSYSVRFSSLKQKSLLSDSEKEEYFDLISKPEVISAVATYLSSGADAKVADSRAKSRLDAVDLLGSALRYAEGDAQNAVAQKIESVLSVNWFKANVSEEEKRIVMGDQLELYQMLSATMPERARRLMQNDFNINQQRLYQFTVSSNERK